MSEDLRPGIPMSCAARPTIGGLVIPWVNVQLADGGVDFRSHHEARSQRCWREGICQLCSNPITGPPMVLLGGPHRVAALTFDEPPLHPECAVYTSKACPMVAGRSERYADRQVISHGQRGSVCPDPGCDCGGWVPTPGTPLGQNGAPNHDWYAVYVSGYSLGVTEANPTRVHAGVITPEQILAIRHVSRPGTGRIWKRTSLQHISSTENQR
jgi:hypothetical protein